MAVEVGRHLTLPHPGEIVLKDFRSSSTAERSKRDAGKKIKLLQWNIERGYKLEGILDEVERLQPDIFCIQEIDIGCDRSNGKDVGLELAERLGMNYAFVCEFEELRSPLRSQRDQGGGVHGNGILTRFDMEEVRPIEHAFHPIDWENPKLKRCKKEPRKGRRLSLSAVVKTPQGPLLTYCCHLEVFCGIIGRISQFVDILQDSRRMYAKGIRNQAILGDLNTMGNGVARLSPSFCSDHLRFKTIGICEARFWKDNLLSVSDTDAKNAALISGTTPVNSKLLKWGVDPALCEEATNPGFVDPWDVEKDVTLEHPAFKGTKIYLVTGKLDWILGRGMTFHSKEIGNHDYSMSDHKWLQVEIGLQ